MDKSWMDRRLSNGRVTDEFKQGVVEFLNFAFRNPRYGDEIACPCKKCCFRYFKVRKHVNLDLLKHGFVENYRVRDKHGEEDTPTDVHSSSSSDEYPQYSWDTSGSFSLQMSRSGSFSLPSTSTRSFHSEHHLQLDTRVVQETADSASRAKKPRGPSKVKKLKDGAKLPEPVLLTDSFYPESVKTQASIAIKFHIPGSRIKWSEWKDCEKTRAWNAFKNLYTWTGDNESKAESVFDEYGKKNYSHFLHQARKMTKREREMGLDPRKNPPPYLSMNVWQEMWKKWDAEEFKISQVRNKSNRNSENVVYHTVGPRTFEEVKLKILQEAKDKKLTHEDIDPLEFYEKTHKKGNDFTTTRAQNIMVRGKAIREELVDLHETQLSQGQTPYPIDPLLDILVPAVGGIRKGRVTGCGSKKISKKVARQRLPAYTSRTYVTREEHESVVKTQQEMMEMITMLKKQVEQKNETIASLMANNSRDTSGESSN